MLRGESLVASRKNKGELRAKGASISSSSPLLSLSLFLCTYELAFGRRIIRAIHLNLPPLPGRSPRRLSSSFSRGMYPLDNYRVDG